jgi:hypothetical protein
VAPNEVHDKVEAWARTLNRALGHPSLHQVGPDVLRVVLRKALSAAFGPGAPTGGADAPRADVLSALGGWPDSWLSADGSRLEADHIPPAPAPVVAGLLAALADQLWRLLGTDASAPFFHALSGG